MNTRPGSVITSNLLPYDSYSDQKNLILNALQNGNKYILRVIPDSVSISIYEPGNTDTDNNILHFIVD